MICKNCNVDFEPKPYRKPKFCSVNCAQIGHRKPIKAICDWCKGEWETIPSRKKKRKFCSQKCQYSAAIGRVVNDETRKKIAKGNYKGDEAGYSAKHKWIAQIKKRTSTCTFCLRTAPEIKRTEWANVSGKYNREDVNDWIELCTKCHKKFDGYFTKEKESTCLRCKQKFYWKGTRRKGLFCSRACWYKSGISGSNHLYKDIIAELKQKLA